MKKILDTGYRIKSEEQLFKLHNIGKGFIFNYFTDGKDAKKYNVLHSADCYWVTKSNTNVKKYFFKTICPYHSCEYHILLLFK